MNLHFLSLTTVCGRWMLMSISVRVEYLILSFRLNVVCVCVVCCVRCLSVCLYVCMRFALLRGNVSRYQVTNVYIYVCVCMYASL